MTMRHLALAIALAFASGGCQLVLGIDPDVATSADAATGEDAAMPADSGVPETGTDAAGEAAKNFNIYVNGQNVWQEERDSGASADDADDSGIPITKPYDIKVTLTREHGAWVALAPGLFDTSHYATFNFNLKPTVANQSWSCALLAPDGGAMVARDVATYGNGMPVTVGQWGYYKVPLVALVTEGTTVSGVVIQDTTSLPNNVWYVDDVGFVP